MARGSSKGTLNAPSTAQPEVPTGDGGAREEEVSQAQATFNDLHEQIDLGEDAGLIVRTATEWVIELFKHRPKPWDQLSQSEQRDLVSGIEHNVHELVRMVVEAVVREGADPVRCLFVGFTDKGDDIKAELKLKAPSKEETEAAVLFFHRARGHHVLVKLASADEFHREPAGDQSEPDQRGMEFEAGSGDIDLEEAASDPMNLKDGDKAAFAGEAGVVRINLAKGWVQFLPEDIDAKVSDETDWQDMREATPAELAGERERTADFADEPAKETETAE